jgi:predicted CopG family antitoxin
MKLTISLSDDLYEDLSARAKAQKSNIQDFILQHILITKDIDLSARKVVLHGNTLSEIESKLDSLHCKSADDLLNALTNRLSIKLGGLDFPLSKAELAELARRAENNGISSEEELKRAIAMVRPLMFHSAADFYGEDFNQV